MTREPAAICAGQRTSIGMVSDFVQHQALVEPAVVAEEEALVGGVVDQRVLRQAVLVEVVEDLPHGVIDRLHAAQVVAHVALVLPRGSGTPRLLALPLELGRQGVLVVALAQVVELHGHLAHHLRASAVLVPHGLRLFDGAGLVIPGLPDGGGTGAVRGLVVDQQAEGPVRVAAVQEVEALLGDDVGGVALDRLLAVGAAHHRVDVGALVGEDPPVVEAAGARALGAAQVPLAVQRRLVAAFVQHLGEGAHPIVELRIDRRRRLMWL